MRNLVFVDGGYTCYDDAVVAMDSEILDEIREELHREMAPCTNQRFFDAYVEKHAEKFDEDFVEAHCRVNFLQWATDEELLALAEEAETWNEDSVECLRLLAMENDLYWDETDDTEDADVIFERIKKYITNPCSANDLYDAALHLYDGGWRSSDENQLRKEYKLAQSELEAIVENLKEIEEKENAND